MFAKEPSTVEILNDFDSNLMNFWSVVKNAPDQFIKSFDYTLVSRETFNTYKQKYKENRYDDAIEKAHVFYYLVNAGFASDMKNPVFGTKCQSKNGLRIEDVDNVIPDVYKRLSKDIFKIYKSAGFEENYITKIFEPFIYIDILVNSVFRVVAAR